VWNQLWDPKFNGWFDNYLCLIVTGEVHGVKTSTGGPGSSTGIGRCWTS
jgi:hypothetical protein